MSYIPLCKVLQQFLYCFTRYVHSRTCYARYLPVEGDVVDEKREWYIRDELGPVASVHGTTDKRENQFFDQCMVEDRNIDDSIYSILVSLIWLPPL